MKNLIFALLLAVSVCYAQSTKKTAVAVMDLRGSGISETDAKFLTERLVIELQNTDVFDVMERDKMNEILKEQGFQQTGACDQTSCLVEAGRLLPIEKMIGGSVGKIGELYSVQVLMIDLKTAKVEKTAVKDFNERIEYLLTKGMSFVASALTTGGKDDKANEDITFKKIKGSDFSYATIIKVGFKLVTGDRYERLLNKNKKAGKIYINKGIAEGVIVDLPLLVLRINEEKSIKDPATMKYLKQVVNTVAEVEVIKVEENYSECNVIKAYNDIKVGDEVFSNYQRPNKK